MKIENSFFKNFGILVIFLLVGGILGFAINNRIDWDFINYRYYNGWAFLNHRLDIDLMPSFFRTYFNPIIDASTYLLMEKLNNFPLLFLFISGLGYGLFLFLSYLIADFIIEKKTFARNFIIFSAVIMCAISPILFMLKGYGSTDIQVACITMLSIYIYMPTIFEKKDFKNSCLTLFAAFLIGCAIGLKYTQAVMALGLIVSTLVFYKKVQQPIKTVLILLFGMFIGFLTTDGYWMYLIYTHFHNPFFPYFNWAFPDSIDKNSTIFSTDYAHLRPKNLSDFILMPLKETSRGFVTTEFGFYDLKLHLGFWSILVYFIISKVKNIKNIMQKYVKFEHFNFIVFMTVFVYYLNLFVFSQIRYIIPLFAFVSIIILVVFCLINHLLQDKIGKISETSLYELLSKINVATIFVFVFLFFILYKFLKSNFIVKYIIRLFKHLHTEDFLNVSEAFYIIVVFYCFVMIYNVIISTNLISKFEKFISKIYKDIEKFKPKEINLSWLQRNMYISISAIVLLILFSTKYMFFPVNVFHYKQIAYIQDMNIKDNSNVIVGTIASSYIVPKQNPNVRYLGFSIPKVYWKDIKQDNGFKNWHFKSEYMETELKKVFAQDNDLYFIFSIFAVGNDLSLYNKSVKYYSDNKITHLKNCKYVNNEVLLNDIYDGIVLCKLK